MGILSNRYEMFLIVILDEYNTTDYITVVPFQTMNIRMGNSNITINCLSKVDRDC